MITFKSKEIFYRVLSFVEPVPVQFTDLVTLGIARLTSSNPVFTNPSIVSCKLMSTLAKLSDPRKLY